MSPMTPTDTYGEQSFPRVSGDEPLYRRTSTRGVMFSPRERG